MADTPDTPSRREPARLVVDNPDFLSVASHGKDWWLAKARRHAITAAVDQTDEITSLQALLDELEPVWPGLANLAPDVIAAMNGLARPAADVIAAMKAEHAKAYRTAAERRGHPPHAKDPSSQPALATRSMAALASVPVPILRYLAADWVPRAKAVLMAGMGGSGKTTLACQLAAARAAGLPFLGLDVDAGVTLALLCEDDADDAHRMLVRLADHFGRQLGDFADFHYLPAAGEDNVLIGRLRNGRIVPTKLYERWQQRVGDLKANLQVIDNGRHVAAINENDGAEVTAAWGLLHGLGRPTGAATMLLGHTPKSGNAEFSGNAAWENVARVRLFLGPVAAEPGEDPIENDPRRIFRRGKANANGTARLDLVWERGAFRLEHPDFGTYGERLDREMRQGQACQAFLNALDVLAKQQRSTSHGEACRNYAPKTIKAAGLASEFTVKELTAAMNALFKDNRIKADMPLPWRDKSRHIAVGIARC